MQSPNDKEQSPILFYHYSNQPFDELLTVREQQKRGLSKITDAELLDRDQDSRFRCQPGSSSDYINFFFDPVPIDLIAGKYPESHPTWAPGRHIWELTVELNDFDEDIPFLVSETQLAQTLSQFFWPGDKAPDILKRCYFKLRSYLCHKQGDQGEGLQALKLARQRHQGTTRDFYEKLLNSAAFNQPHSYLQNMYAPNVPHVMTWPISGALLVKNKKEIFIPTGK